MIIRIKKRENPYVQIDRRAIEDDRISWRAKGILAYLLSKPDDWTVRTDDIIKHGDDGRDAVRSAMKELSKAGYATLVNTSEGRQWLISEEPSPENPSMGEPCPENPRMGLANMAKTPPSNNKGRSNNKTTNEDFFLSQDSGEKSKGIDEQAAMIYAAYPLKVARAAAIKSIKSAIKKAGFEKLLNATNSYRKARAGDMDFVPHPATWFNQERYADEPNTWIPKRTGLASTQARPQNVEVSDSEWSNFMQQLREKQPNVTDFPDYDSAARWAKDDFHKWRKAQ